MRRALNLSSKVVRHGRRVKGLLYLVNEMKSQHVHFKSLTDSIDTKTPVGRFFFHVMASLAQMEQELIVERTRAVSGSRDRTLRVWNLESGQTVRTLEGHTDAVQGVAVTPDGHRAVSASRDRTLRVWDLQSVKEITTFTGEDRIFSCAFAQDGRTIIAGSESGRVHFLQPSSMSGSDSKWTH
jgi:WD40 repeat protein